MASGRRRKSLQSESNRSLFEFSPETSLKAVRRKLCMIKMLTSAILGHLRSTGRCVRQLSKRHIGISAIALQKNVDPVQQLFVQKVREYAQKRKSSGGKLVDATPDVTKHLQEEMDRVVQRFGAASQDMSKFPSFEFEDKPVEAPPKGEKATAEHALPL